MPLLGNGAPLEGPDGGELTKFDLKVLGLVLDDERLRAFDVHSEARRVAREAQGIYGRAKGGPLDKLEAINHYLDGEAEGFYRAFDLVTAAKPVHGRRWDTNHVALHLGHGEQFHPDELSKELHDPGLRTRTLIIGRVFLKLHGLEYAIRNSRLVQMYGLATLLKAMSDEIVGLEPLPDEVRLSSEVVPPALPTGVLFQERMGGVARRLWGCYHRVSFAELNLKFALINTVTPIWQCAHHSKTPLMTTSKAPFLPEQEGGTLQDFDLTLYTFAKWLAGLQFKYESRDDARNFHADFQRCERAVDLVEQAGGNTRPIVDSLLSRLSWQEEHGAVGPFDFAEYGETLRAHYSRPGYGRRSKAPQLFGPLVELMRSLP